MKRPSSPETGSRPSTYLPGAAQLGGSVVTRHGTPGTRAAPPSSWTRSRSSAATPPNCGGRAARSGGQPGRSLRGRGQRHQPQRHGRPAGARRGVSGSHRHRPGTHQQPALPRDRREPRHQPSPGHRPRDHGHHRPRPHVRGTATRRDLDLEAVEFRAGAGSKITRGPLSRSGRRTGARPSWRAVYRRGRAAIPRGDTVLEDGDEVVVIVKPKHAHSIQGLFQERS